jgi:xanthine dehydrogenase YagR molybdenum-binding subunit
MLTRRQMYSSNGYRSKTIQRLRLAAERDGRLVAMMHDGVLQTATFGEFVEPVGLPAEMMYACPNVAVTHRVAPINAGLPTYMRAPGESTGMYALESAIDELAVTLDIDPLELRLRNHADRDEHDGRPWSSKSLKACYARGAEAFGWARRNRRAGATRQGGAMIGWGMASATYPANRSPAAATVRLLADGTAIVRSGTQDIGTGTYTIMAQVAADALGLPVARVTAELGDSNLPQAPVSGGSQTAASVMPAVQAAARDVHDQLVALATNAPDGKLAGAKPSEIRIADGGLFLTRDPSRREAVGAVLSRAGREAIEATRDTKPAPDAKKYGAAKRSAASSTAWAWR